MIPARGGSKGVLRKNIREVSGKSLIARTIEAAQGLRQPIHVEDVAAVCFSALRAPDAANRAYNISGGETLTYSDMVERVFVALGRSTHTNCTPLCVSPGGDIAVPLAALSAMVGVHGRVDEAGFGL